jgi:hypothetical protein
MDVLFTSLPGLCWRLELARWALLGLAVMSGIGSGEQTNPFQIEFGKPGHYLH